MACRVGTAAWRGTRGIARSSSTRLPCLRLCMALLGGRSLAQTYRERWLPAGILFPRRTFKGLPTFTIPLATAFDQDR